MKLIKPIYNSTNQVLTSMLALNSSKGEVITKKDSITTQKLNISVGITGDLKGSLFFSLSEKLTLNLVQEMSGMEINTIDNFASSAMSELANIICGNTITELNKQNYICNITPPRIINGSNNQVSVFTDEIKVLPIKTKMGNLIINISLEKNNS